MAWPGGPCLAGLDKGWFEESLTPECGQRHQPRGWSRASSQLVFLALQVIRDRHTWLGCHSLPTTNPPPQTWGCSSKHSSTSRNLPYPHTVPAPGRRAQPACPLPYRLPELSLATSLLSLVFNLWPGLANTTIQKKLSSLATGKASSPCLGFIWEQFCSLKGDGAPPGLGGSQPSLGFKEGLCSPSSIKSP